MSDRESNGKQIAERPDQIKRIDENWYQVRAQSLGYESWYDVILIESGFVCDCPDNQWRNVKCKHIHAVEFSLQIRKQVQSVVINQVETNQCKFCNSTDIIRKGIRKNKTYCLQVYKCRTCNKKFSINLGFEKMKASPQIITSAMQLYFTGESLRNVQKFLELQGVKITHKTVWNWIKKYTKLMQDYSEKLKPRVSDTWRADEMFLKIKGNMKYMYAMMDDETRFWIAQEVADTKYTHDVQGLFKEAKRVTERNPKTLITDGAFNYKTAYYKEYWTREVKNRPKHVRHIRFWGDNNNNKMERMNGEVRDREKVMRGLKKKDTPILKGYQVFHNYFRTHEGLNGKTPAEACGIKIEGDNKWITLIQNAQVSKVNTDKIQREVS